MSFTFTKLFSSITESTIWMEPSNVRIVWIAMLAMADRKGRVWATVPGLSNRARVPLEDCRLAIETFLQPDPDSRTKVHAGRRIQEIEGGWLIINHEKYRNIRDEESIKESKRNYINERRRLEREGNKPSVENVEQCRSLSIQAEADTESEAVNPPIPSPAPPLTDSWADEIYAAYPRRQGRKAALKAIRSALRVRGPAELLDAVKAYSEAVAQWPSSARAQYVPHPSTWFNRGSYDDDRETWVRQESTQGRASFA